MKTNLESLENFFRLYIKILFLLHGHKLQHSTAILGLSTFKDRRKGNNTPSSTRDGI
jgi:hypothetical protein